MAITEENRHQLYRRLEEVLGHDEATTMMEHLPPVGWADVATKRDLDGLEARIDARFDTIDARFGNIDARFDAMDARFDARLERALREQTNRFLVGTGALLTLFLTVQQLLAGV